MHFMNCGDKGPKIPQILDPLCRDIEIDLLAQISQDGAVDKETMENLSCRYSRIASFLNTPPLSFMDEDINIKGNKN